MSPTERLAARNGKKICKLLAEVVAACRADGLGNPKLFFEPESAAIFVMNGDHPGYVDSDKCGMAGRQEAIVERIPIYAPGCPFDAGAW
jgi:hypothetical protein